MLSVLFIWTASTKVAATSAIQSSATTSNATGPTEGTSVYIEDSSSQGECTCFLLALLVYCGRRNTSAIVIVVVIMWHGC